MKIRRAAERGHADHGWLNAYHTFSFADYYDPQHMGFRSLRVINDDTVAGGGGFDMHPHRDMEIITYILSGALQHRDSMGNSAVMRAGDVQRISAGSGILHSEFNHSEKEPVHLLQIWIKPDEKSVKPDYAERSFANAPSGQLTLIASKTGRDNSIGIHQDADVFLGKFQPGESVKHTLQAGRHAWLQVGEGEIMVNGQLLQAGDGAAISEAGEISLNTKQPSQVILFDLN